MQLVMNIIERETQNGGVGNHILSASPTIANTSQKPTGSII